MYKWMGVQNPPIASSVKEYVNLTLTLLNDDEKYESILEQICDLKHKLYESTESVSEWSGVLQSLARR